MPCHAGWKLKNPRPIHFRLAELLAQGLAPKDCARLTGISLWQVYRLRGSPLLQEMIAHARQSLLEADTLAKQGLDAILTREELKLLADLGRIRDFSPNVEHRLSACFHSQRLIARIRQRQEKQAQEPDEIRVILELPPGFHFPSPQDAEPPAPPQVPSKLS